MTEHATGSDWILPDEASNWKEDLGLQRILIGILLAFAVALLPQFGWFQSLTGIDGWVNFLRVLFG
jgi:hypothetical protein